MKKNVFEQNHASTNEGVETREELLHRMSELGRVSISEDGLVTVNDKMMVESIAQATGVGLDVVDTVINAEVQYMTQIGIYEAVDNNERS